jgi:hypothetical protein
MPVKSITLSSAAHFERGDKGFPRQFGLVRLFPGYRFSGNL